jgi:hypothetical protein
MSQTTPLAPDDKDVYIQPERVLQTVENNCMPSLDQPSRTHGGRRAVKIEVSDALFDALNITAAQQHVTKRYLILSALRNAGFPVESSDFLEDGRRLRGSRKE